MMHTAARSRSRYLLCAGALALAFAAGGLPASAQQPTSKQVAAKLVCGSFSADPHKMKPYESKFAFTVSGPLWTSDVADQRGKERFLGILSPSGTMLIVGEGKSDDGATWTYEFSGRKKQDSLTILRGSLQSQKPKGSRACSLAF
jgi:hypothetical protein